MANTRTVDVDFAASLFPSNVTLPLLVTRGDLPDEMFDPSGSYSTSDGATVRTFQSAAEVAREIVNWELDSSTAAADAVIEAYHPVAGDAVAGATMTYEYGGALSEPASTDTYGSEAVWSAWGIVTHLNSTSPVDSSGNATLTKNGAPALVTDGPSGLQGLNFNGSSDSIDTGITTTSETRTILAIVQADSAPSGANYAIVGGKAEGGQITWNHGSASFRGAAVAKRGGNWYSESLGTLSATTLYHLAMVLDAGNIYGYTDGSLANSQATSGTIPTDTYEIKIAEHATTADKFAGSIYEFRSIDQALSADELSVLYNNINSPSSYTTVGTPSSISGGTSISAGVGTVASAGQSVTLERGRDISAGQGSASFGGQTVSLETGYSISADLGVVAASGQTVTLERGRDVTPGVGSASIAGLAVSLSTGLLISAGQGAISIAGQAVSLLRGRDINIGVGSLVMFGRSVTFATGAASGFLRGIMRGVLRPIMRRTMNKP